VLIGKNQEFIAEYEKGVKNGPYQKRIGDEYE